MPRREEPIPALSAGLSYVMMTGLLLLAANLPRFSAFAPIGAESNGASQSAHLALPATPSAANSAVPPASAPPEGAVVEPVEVEWAAEEITRGREQCMHLLSSASVEFDYLAPIRMGACGSPAPVQLKSVGSGTNKVTFDPPVHVNCRMAAALGTWVKSTLQPHARARLKSRVVGILGASGYSCRNIYNRPNDKLSQHALANAVDVGAFSLADGRTVRVLKGWGLTARDVNAQAKARAKAKATAAGKAKAGSQNTASVLAKGRDGKTASAVTKASLKTGAPPEGKAQQSGGKLAANGASKPEGDASVNPATPTKEAMFLRAVHGGACGTFGTVLGPEANDPHRNHFHLDLIPRRGRGYCR